MDVVKKLVALANALDMKGAYEEASMLDDVLRSFAQEPQKPMSAMERMRWEAEQRRKGKNPYAPGSLPQYQQKPTQAPAQQQTQPTAPAQSQQQAQTAPAQPQQRKPLTWEQQRGKTLQRAEQKRQELQETIRQRRDQQQGFVDQPEDVGAGKQRVELKPQPGSQQAGRQKRRMSPQAKQRWQQHYQNMATVMGLQTSNPRAVFKEVQKKYPGLYQKGMTAKQLYDEIAKRELRGQTSQAPAQSTQPAPQSTQPAGGGRAQTGQSPGWGQSRR